ncbi:MAG: hypothetical protein ACP5QK_00710 [Myxococcota bacterium]
MNNLLTSYSINFEPPLSDVLSIIVAIIILLLTAYSIKNLLFYLSIKVRVLLAILRTLSVLTFLFIFFEPSIVETTYYLEKDTVAILVDASRSMSISSDGLSRLQIAKRVASKIIGNNELRKEHNIVIYSFSKKTHLNSSVEDISILNEDSTDIVNSLEDIRLRHQDLSNIILISDGADNNLLQNRGGDITDILKNFAKNLEIPVHTILAGNENSINDVAIKVISASPIGFAGKEFEVSLLISNNSNITETIPVKIKENDTPIYSTSLRVPFNQSKQIKVTLFPKNMGRNVYEVSIPPFSDETNLKNNVDYFTSKIRKESFRILQISGSVSYDVRFLRHLFKKAPDIDLISFFILRTLESDVNAPDSELSLIPFPADSVIKESLFSFDVVILQDFGFVPYGLNTTFSELNNFIRRGGGLIFITGNNWYRWIGDYITFFNDCMPATPRTDDNAIENIIFRPELTSDGKNHPIMRILDSMEENTILFRNLPELHGIHRINNIKPTSLSLMSAKITENETLPIFLINRCEKGRTALITTDELWRFSFSEKTPDEFNLYNKLMNNLLLWITAEPDREDIVISQSQQSSKTDELRGRLASIIYSNDIKIQIENGTTIQGKINSDGEFSFDISKVEDGIHNAKVLYNDRIYNIYFYKKLKDIEMQDISLRADVLKAIARYSNGKYYKDNDISDKEFSLQKRPIKKIQERKRTPLWNKTIFLALIIILFSIEWFTRRMYGHQ